LANSVTFVALSGLPRTGSTLLSAILSQNPDIHAEGNSAVCQLMWDMHMSCEGSASEQLRANRREAATQDALVSAVPAIYYREVTARHIVDKCRSWTLPANMMLLRRYITPQPKVIVLTRPVDEIVDSFVRLRRANNWTGDLGAGLREPGSEPIMRSLEGVEWAKTHNSGEFLFIEYADLVENTASVLDQVYEFTGIEPFAHDLDHIVNRHPEDDSVYGLAGQHDIRPTIGYRHSLV
jgi:sulfotransferase